MPECGNCGEFVSPAFARVFGDNDDRVHACPDCRNQTEMIRGRAAGLSYSVAMADGGTDL